MSTTIPTSRSTTMSANKPNSILFPKENSCQKSEICYSLIQPLASWQCSRWRRPCASRPFPGQSCYQNFVLLPLRSLWLNWYVDRQLWMMNMSKGKVKRQELNRSDWKQYSNFSSFNVMNYNKIKKIKSHLFLNHVLVLIWEAEPFCCEIVNKHHHHHENHYLMVKFLTLEIILNIRLNILGNTCKRPEILVRLDVRPNILKYQYV